MVAQLYFLSRKKDKIMLGFLWCKFCISLNLFSIDLINLQMFAIFILQSANDRFYQLQYALLSRLSVTFSYLQ